MELSRQISNYLIGKQCKVYPSPFCVRLLGDDKTDDETIKNVVEPDITIVFDKSKLDETGCKGTPDTIIEIVSPSIGRRDKFEKFNKYEKAGVKEYWIVEPQEKLVNTFRLQKNNRYGRPEIFTNEDTVKVSIFDNLNYIFKVNFHLKTCKGACHQQNK